MLFPLESAFLPFVDESDNQDEEEDTHGSECSTGYGIQSYGPGNQEGNFEIKNDEKNGDQIVANVKFHSRILERLKAAFVG